MSNHMKPCPSCKQLYDSRYPASSRLDNGKTKICPTCGDMEGLFLLREEQGYKREWKEVIWWLMSLVPPPKDDDKPKYRSIDEE